jgi:hypothetical protein
MHIKAAFSGDPHSGQRGADALGQRGIAIANTGPGSLSWFDRLMTPRVAVWAHDAAPEIIRAFLALVPAPSDYDPLTEHRRSFRPSAIRPPLASKSRRLFQFLSLSDLLSRDTAREVTALWADRWARRAQRLRNCRNRCRAPLPGLGYFQRPTIYR